MLVINAGSSSLKCSLVDARTGVAGGSDLAEGVLGQRPPRAPKSSPFDSTSSPHHCNGALSVLEHRPAGRAQQQIDEPTVSSRADHNQRRGRRGAGERLRSRHRHRRQNHGHITTALPQPGHDLGEQSAPRAPSPPRPAMPRRRLRAHSLRRRLGRGPQPGSSVRHRRVEGEAERPLVGRGPVDAHDDPTGVRVARPTYDDDPLSARADDDELDLS